MKNHDAPSDKPRPLADLTPASNDIKNAPPTLPASAPTEALTTPAVHGSIYSTTFRNDWVKQKVQSKCFGGENPILHVEHPPHMLQVIDDVEVDEAPEIIEIDDDDDEIEAPTQNPLTGDVNQLDRQLEKGKEKEKSSAEEENGGLDISRNEGIIISEATSMIDADLDLLDTLMDEDENVDEVSGVNEVVADITNGDITTRATVDEPMADVQSVGEGTRPATAEVETLASKGVEMEAGMMTENTDYNVSAEAEDPTENQLQLKESIIQDKVVNDEESLIMDENAVPTVSGNEEIKEPSQEGLGEIIANDIVEENLNDTYLAPQSSEAIDAVFKEMEGGVTNNDVDPESSTHDLLEPSDDIGIAGTAMAQAATPVHGDLASALLNGQEDQVTLEGVVSVIEESTERTVELIPAAEVSVEGQADVDLIVDEPNRIEQEIHSTVTIIQEESSDDAILGNGQHSTNGDVENSVSENRSMKENITMLATDGVVADNMEISTKESSRMDMDTSANPPGAEDGPATLSPVANGMGAQEGEHEPAIGGVMPGPNGIEGETARDGESAKEGMLTVQDQTEEEGNDGMSDVSGMDPALIGMDDM